MGVYRRGKEARQQRPMKISPAEAFLPTGDAGRCLERVVTSDRGTTGM